MGDAAQAQVAEVARDLSKAGAEAADAVSETAGELSKELKKRAEPPTPLQPAE